MTSLVVAGEEIMLLMIAIFKIFRKRARLVRREFRLNVIDWMHHYLTQKRRFLLISNVQNYILRYYRWKRKTTHFRFGYPT